MASGGLNSRNGRDAGQIANGTPPTGPDMQQGGFHRSGVRIDLPKALKDIPTESIRTAFNSDASSIRDIRHCYTLKKEPFVYVNFKPESPQGLETKLRGKPIGIMHKGQRHEVFVFDERTMGVKMQIAEPLFTLKDTDLRLALLSAYPMAVDAAVRHQINDGTTHVFVNFRSPADADAARARGEVIMESPHLPGLHKVRALPKLNYGWHGSQGGNGYHHGASQQSGSGGSSSPAAGAGGLVTGGGNVPSSSSGNSSWGGKRRGQGYNRSASHRSSSAASGTITPPNGRIDDTRREETSTPAAIEEAVGARVVVEVVPDFVTDGKDAEPVASAALAAEAAGVEFRAGSLEAEVVNGLSTDGLSTDAAEPVLEEDTEEVFEDEEEDIIIIVAPDDEPSGILASEVSGMGDALEVHDGEVYTEVDQGVESYVDEQQQQQQQQLHTTDDSISHVDYHPHQHPHPHSHHQPAQLAHHPHHSQHHQHQTVPHFQQQQTFSQDIRRGGGFSAPGGRRYQNQSQQQAQQAQSQQGNVPVPPGLADGQGAANALRPSAAEFVPSSQKPTVWIPQLSKPHNMHQQMGQTPAHPMGPVPPHIHTMPPPPHPLQHPHTHQPIGPLPLPPHPMHQLSSAGQPVGSATPPTPAGVLPPGLIPVVQHHHPTTLELRIPADMIDPVSGNDFLEMYPTATRVTIMTLLSGNAVEEEGDNGKADVLFSGEAGDDSSTPQQQAIEPDMYGLHLHHHHHVQQHNIHLHPMGHLPPPSHHHQPYGHHGMHHPHHISQPAMVNQQHGGSAGLFGGKGYETIVRLSFATGLEALRACGGGMLVRGQVVAFGFTDGDDDFSDHLDPTRLRLHLPATHDTDILASDLIDLLELHGQTVTYVAVRSERSTTSSAIGSQGTNAIMPGVIVGFADVEGASRMEGCKVTNELVADLPSTISHIPDAAILRILPKMFPFDAVAAVRIDEDGERKRVAVRFTGDRIAAFWRGREVSVAGGAVMFGPVLV
ncbi:hypothetical protein HDU67_001824 [Dinochytrium kinnereticum]|nr:hypothetical protein HDU67_001824 [Dinochytrium kinnereticum]